MDCAKQASYADSMKSPWVYLSKTSQAAHPRQCWTAMRAVERRLDDEAAASLAVIGV
jgi:hypothetical protein